MRVGAGKPTAEARTNAIRLNGAWRRSCRLLLMRETDDSTAVVAANGGTGRC
jgi:hypothetical protein